MLSKKQLGEIRDHLEKAQNPIFLYDNDVDGLCSYVVLRRFIGRGKGVAVKSHPNIDINYAKRVQELGGDYVFVLDRHSLGEDFVKEIEMLQIPIVWIDHHDVESKSGTYNMLHTYNPSKNKRRSAEPTTYLCYKATKRFEDVWIAMMGCLSDHYLNKSVVKDFVEKYEHFWANDIKKPFQGLYSTLIGKLARSLSFGLKDSITHVVELQNFLINCKDPVDLEHGLDSKSAFAAKYSEISKKYQSLLGEANKCASDKLLFYNYGGQLSISSDLANELSYLYPKHYICVAYSSGPITNISFRGKNVSKILSEVLGVLGRGTGGGHRDAVGARIDTSDLDKFKEEVLKRV
jgi:oligoribonuclease NrnB/cAMP/cGMP phosphodiesterase (DHH superfamily)